MLAHSIRILVMIDWGDFSPTTILNLPVGSRSLLRTIPIRFGTYTISITVMDDDGGIDSMTFANVAVVEATSVIVTDPVWGKNAGYSWTDLDDQITVNQSMEVGNWFIGPCQFMGTDRTYPAAGPDHPDAFV